MWHSATDGAGRQYFYKEGSSATSWSLPKVSNHPLLTRRHGSADNVPALVETPAPHVAQPLAPSLKRHQGPSLAVNELKEEEDEVEDRSISPLMSSTATKMLEKSGMLNKTRLTDSSGKKVKKNWSPSYVVAQGTELLFYKDQKAAQPKSGSSLGRPEAKLDLFGATVQIHIAAKDISSKKNFIHLVLLEGDQYLLQWYNATSTQYHHSGKISHYLNKFKIIFNHAPITHSASMNSLEDSLESPKGTLDRATSLSPPDSKHARKGSKKNERPKTPDGDLSSAERNRIKMRLIKWLLRRPTMESLQEKGIIQDGVFGSHILTICEREKNNTPNFVTNCIKAIEARGLEVDGIYRVNGNAAQMQKLRYLVDQNQSYNLLDPEWDVHVITGALKLFFRELREPLIPFSFFNKFMDANKITDRVMKARSFKDLIKLLPHPNRETMRALFTHFVKVSEKSQKNLMQPHTLAIVYGPTLMWPAQESANMAITLVQQNQIIEICILDIKHIFT
ncbi:hypothetical protein CAPTEDRAFT_186977 [Capitella teleta]|uniref:Rho-GAP domain-containing protein n=1 Tax=Capitella teleta TaxID=283909 RepID=R7VIT6_CAPTE|nr:hypothetical protein CAPTEDRAFT_186977 [Capitella teleta]|eukprot:ELU18544.1 hypothetical protein CAPTEDRAFT_186977 [Capitella teleta]